MREVCPAAVVARPELVRLLEVEAADLVTDAIHCNGLALEHVSHKLRGDCALVHAAVQQNGLALKFAGSLKKDPAMVMAAVRQCGLALEFSELQPPQEHGRARGGRRRAAAKAVDHRKAVTLTAIRQNLG